MAKTSPHKVIYARLSPELHEKLTNLAKVDKRSISNLLEVIVEQYVNERSIAKPYRPEPDELALLKQRIAESDAEDAEDFYYSSEEIIAYTDEIINQARQRKARS